MFNRRKLPPLNALRAFEAAARHLSFTRAADELAVTQAAVSHQVKTLEDWVGRKLFRRRNRTVYLTEDGQNYLRDLTEAFDLLADATMRLTTGGASGVLTVSVLPSFATKWLVPRLGDFREKHPDIDLRIAATPDSVDFRTTDVDMAIRSGTGDWPDLHIQFLMTEDLFPVCSPRLLQGPLPLEKPGDLKGHTLLHDYDTMDEWTLWLTAAGVDPEAAGIDPQKGPSFDDASMVFEAAVEGQGVAMGRSLLVKRDLEAGRLVRPFDFTLPWRFDYYIVCPPGHESLPNVETFTGWLIEMAASEDREIDLPPTRTADGKVG